MFFQIKMQNRRNQWLAKSHIQYELSWRIPKCDAVTQNRSKLQRDREDDGRTLIQSTIPRSLLYIRLRKFFDDQTSLFVIFLSFFFFI